MGPRLSSWSSSPVDKYSKLAGTREELSPAQMKDHIFIILHVKKTFPTTYMQKGSLEVKRGRALAHSSDVKQAAQLEFILAKRCTFTNGRTLRKTKSIWFWTQNQVKQNDQLKKPRRYIPQKVIQTTSVQLSLSLPVSLSTCTHFPPNKGFTTFCLDVKINFYTAEGLDSCPWSLGFTVLTAAV